MPPWTKDKTELYSSQFDNAGDLTGKRIESIQFYLDETDADYNEQPNVYGKSLLNGIDIIADGISFTIRNGFWKNCGLRIDKGQVSEFERLDEGKKAVAVPLSVVGQQIKSVEIYWLPIPIHGAIGYYPQEIEIYTEQGYLLFSSMEVNLGQVNLEFTDELLIIDNEKTAGELALGRFGTLFSGRLFFKDLKALMEADLKTWK